MKSHTYTCHPMRSGTFAIHRGHRLRLLDGRLLVNGERLDAFMDYLERTLDLTASIPLPELIAVAFHHGYESARYDEHRRRKRKATRAAARGGRP